MSIRRRAIKARVERDAKWHKSFEKQSLALKGIQALVDRKKAAGDKIITDEEIRIAMTPEPAL